MIVKLTNFATAIGGNIIIVVFFDVFPYNVTTGLVS